LTLCEGDSDIDHDPFPDHLDDHFDHLDDLHDMVGPILDNDKVIHRVELVEHNGDILTKYATTSHTNQETKNEIFPNTITTIQQSNVPASFTKVIKKTVIKQSNNDGNSSPETDLSMNDMYSTNKLKENGISNNSMSKSQTLSQMDHMKNIGLPPLPLQKTSDLQGNNIKNIIHTTVTKTTTSAGSPSNELNESFNRKHSLDGLSSNNIISTTSSTKSNFNDGTAISGSLQSNSMEGGSNIKKISMTEDMIDGNGINKSQRISRTPVGSFRRTKTTIIKQHSINDDNDREDLDKSNMEFNTENISSNNIASSMANPLGFNTMTTTTIDRGNSNNNAFNQGIPSRREKSRFNKFNGNSVSESGISQNPGSFVQTKTTIIKNGRAADEIKLDDLNGGKIDYGIDSGFSNLNNNINSNYIVSSSNNGNDDDSNFNYYGYKKGYGSGLQNNYNGNYYGISENKYNGNIMSSNMLDNEYVLEYSNGNGKKKKRKKKGSTKKYQGGRSKNIAYGSRKRNGQREVKNGSNYKSTRSSKSRSGGSSRYYSSNSYVKGQSKSLSSSESASGEISTGKKTSCHCKKGQKLNKRDSSESNQNSYLTENFGAGSHYLSNSIDNQQMKNNGDFPPFMGREPPPNLMLNMILRQQPGQLLNDGQSDVTTVLNRQGETRSQHIDDHHSAFMPDFKNGQYFESLGLDIGSNSGPSLGPGPDLGKGPGHVHGHGHGHSHGPGPGPGHGPGQCHGHGHGPGRGHGPGPGLGSGPGKGANFGPGFGPGKGPGQEANLFDSTSFYNDNFFDQNQRLPLPFSPSQFPYPYSFNKDNYSDFSKMDITTPEFMDIQSGQENQVNINTILPQIQQDSDNEGSGFNQMDAVNSRSITTHTRSNMIKNINSDPIIEYKKIIETTNNIEDNSIPVRHIVQMLSVPPEV